jgi:hypothetical protein
MPVRDWLGKAITNNVTNPVRDTLPIREPLPTPGAPRDFSSPVIDTDPAGHNHPSSDQMAAERFGNSYAYRHPGDNRHIDTPEGMGFTRNDNLGREELGQSAEFSRFSQSTWS